MERFRERVAETIRVEDQAVTISVGLAQARWVQGASLEEIQGRLIEEADQNLYAAKRNGRNQVQWQPMESATTLPTVPPLIAAEPSPSISLPF
jgi:GGDEF domain-containing protein